MMNNTASVDGEDPLWRFHSDCEAKIGGLLSEDVSALVVEE